MAAIDYLTLRSTFIYKAPGVLADAGTVYVISTNGIQTLSASISAGATSASTIITLGASTNTTYNNFLGGSFTTGWASTLTGRSAVTKVAISQSGQYQFAVQNGSSTINTSVNSGATWSSLTGANGLPAGALAYPQATASGVPAYTSISASATGQYQLASVNNGLLYVCANGTSTTPTFTAAGMGAPTIYLPFENSLTDVISNTTITPTGSPGYVTGVVGNNAVNLLNTRSTVQNYANFTGSETIATAYDQTYFTYTATANMTFTSITVQASGSTNNGGFIGINVWLNGTLVYSTNYGFTDVRDTVLDPIALQWSSRTLLNGQVLQIQWSTFAAGRTFLKRSITGGALPTRFSYTTDNATTYIRGNWSGSSNFSTNFWFNAQSYSTTLQEIFSAYGGQYAIYINNTDNKLYVSLPSGGTALSPINTSFSIILNTWYFLSCNFQTNGVCTMYVNNKLIGTYTNTGGVGSYTTTQFSLGCVDNSTAYSFNGYIEDFRLYNSVPTFSPIVPMKWSHAAISATGQYMLASCTNGGLFQSLNYGVTWTQVNSAISFGSSWSGLCMSSSGQYQVGTYNLITSPNQTSLASFTWAQNNVSWIVSASSTLASYPAYGAFNNSSAVGGWATAILYSAGAYTGSTVTIVQGGVGSVSGEWLQLQSSVPLVMQSYSFACGGTVGQIPKIYYIVGSTDGSTWFPIQYVSMTTNPFTATYTNATTYLNVNQSGTQTILAGQLGSGAFTTYPATTTGAYTYFRMIVPAIWLSTVIEIGEWYINFVGGQTYSTDSGTTWTNTVSTTDAFNIVKSATLTSSLSSYITLPPFIPSSTGITFSIWFSLASTPGDWARLIDFSAIINKPVVNGNYSSLLLSFNSSKLIGQIIVGQYTSAIAYSIVSPTTLSTSTVYHAVWTISSSGSQTLYLNGASNATAAGVMNIDTHVFCYLGKSAYSSDPYLNGSISDFRMYNRALSAGEVSVLYAATANPTITQSFTALSGNGQYFLTGSGQTAYLTNNYLTSLGTVNTVLNLPSINANINCASISGSGQYIVIMTQGTSNNVFYSTNYGATFTALTVGSAAMTSCAISYDGSYITVSNATTVYTLNRNVKGYSVTVGNQAGSINQGLNAIAIGNQAGKTNQSGNSIVLNASGTALDAYTSGLFVAPINTTAASVQSSVALLGYGTDSQVTQTGATADVYNTLTVTSLTAPIDPIAQGLYITPSVTNAQFIRQYFQKVTSTSNPTGVVPFWANGMAYSTTGTTPGGSAYYGGVLVPDGRVIFVPLNATTIGIFTPSTNTYSTTGTTAGGSTYFGGVLAPDGRVIFVPFGATTVGIFTPSTNTFSTVAGAPGGNAYIGGVLLPDSRVLFVPCNATTIGFFNPASNTYSTITPTSPALPGSSAYSGGVLLQDGRVVFVPFSATAIGIFTPSTNTYSTITPTLPVLPGNITYYAGVLLPDGRVLFVPSYGNSIGIFNPSTNIYSVIPMPLPTSYSYVGGVLLPDGRVLFIPYNATTFCIFNPLTNTYNLIAGAPGGGAYVGGTLLPDGRVILVPATNTKIGIINTFLSAPRDMCLSPYLNKF